MTVVRVSSFGNSEASWRRRFRIQDIVRMHGSQTIYYCRNHRISESLISRKSRGDKLRVVRTAALLRLNCVLPVSPNKLQTLNDVPYGSCHKPLCQSRPHFHDDFSPKISSYLSQGNETRQKHSRFIKLTCPGSNGFNPQRAASPSECVGDCSD